MRSFRDALDDPSRHAVHRRGRGAREPWLLHLSYIKPHWPYIAPAPYHACTTRAMSFRRSAARRARQRRIRSIARSWTCGSRAISRERCARARHPDLHGPDQADRRSARPAVRLPEEVRARRDDPDRLHLRSRRLSRRPLAGREGSVSRGLGQGAADRGSIPRRMPMRRAGSMCDALVEAIDLAPTFIEHFGGVAPASRRRGPLACARCCAARRRRDGAPMCSPSTTIRCRTSAAASACRPTSAGCSWCSTAAGNTSTRPVSVRCCTISSRPVRAASTAAATPACADVRAKLREALLEWALTDHNRITMSDARIERRGPGGPAQGRDPDRLLGRGRSRGGAPPHRADLTRGVRLASRAGGAHAGGMKIATFNINNVNKRLPNLLAWLRAAKPDVVCLQELKAADARFPAAAIETRRLRRGLARPEDLERRRHPGARHASRSLTRTRAARRSGGHAEPLHRGGGQRHPDRLLYAPNGNPQPGPKFDYKLAWMERLDRACARRSTRRACRSCWPATTTSCRRPRHLPDELLRQGRAGAAGRAAPPFDGCSRKAGPTRSARCIPMRRCTPSGTTCGTAGRATPGCASTISCSAPSREASRRRRRRSRGARRSERERSRAGLGRAARRRQPPRAKRPRRSQARRATRAAKAARAASTADAPAAAGHRRRFLRASRLPRAAEDDPARAQSAGRRDPRLRQFPAAASTRRSSRARCWSAGTRSTAPTYRHAAFAAYQSGREFDDELVEQLALLPDFVAACGFANAKAAGYEADDFLAAAVAREEKRGGTALVASGDRDTFQLASDRDHHPLSDARGRDRAHRAGRGARALRGRSEAGARLHRAARRSVRQAAGRARRRREGAAALLRRYGSLDALLEAGRFPAQAEQLRLFRSIATMDREGAAAAAARSDADGGTRPPRWRGHGGCRSWRSGSTQWPRTQHCWSGPGDPSVHRSICRPASPSSTAISATMTISGIRSPSHKLRSRLIELTLALSKSRADRCRSGCAGRQAPSDPGRPCAASFASSSK